MKMESENYLKIAIYSFTNTSKDSNNVWVKYMHLLQKATGMNFKFLDKVDVSFNTKHSNGSWGGLIGMVIRGEADLALANFDMTEERMEVVDFLYPYMLDEYTFATKHPEYSPEMFAFLYPFQFPVWITLALSLIFISAISSVAFAKNYSPVKVLFHHIAAITGNITKMKFRNMRSRIISFSWMFGMMFLAYCYKSVLLSFMTVPTLKGVRDFKELTTAVQQGRYQCIVSRLSILPDMLLSSDDKSLRILAENIRDSPNGYGGHRVLLQNYRGKIALLDTRSLLTFLNRKFYISDDRIYQMLFAHFVRKTFSRRRELDLGVLRIADSGLFIKLFNEVLFRLSLRVFSSQSYEEVVSVRMLSLFEVSGIFIILICGYFVAAIALVIEIFYYKYY